MLRRRLIVLAAFLTLCGGIAAGPAHATGGQYVFDGGTPAEQAQVRQALAASSFDFDLIGHTITVHIGNTGSSDATPGNVYLDARLLDTGEFSWGVVQHEFGHQVDFFLLDDAQRAELQQDLGGLDWCYETPGLQHSDHACERFASEFAWAFWANSANCSAPTGPDSESGHMPIAAFRSLLLQMIGAPAPTPSQTVATAKVPAPKVKGATKTQRHP